MISPVLIDKHLGIGFSNKDGKGICKRFACLTTTAASTWENL
jgi:hypothetical protein